MTGNKQGCWCRHGWCTEWRRRRHLLNPQRKSFSLPAILAVHLLSHSCRKKSGEYLPRDISNLAIWSHRLWFWLGERLAVTAEGCMGADALLCVLYLRTNLLILLGSLSLVPAPQLAHKADNELFIAAIQLHTSRYNCFSLWFPLWLCILTARGQENLTKKTMGSVIAADEWVCTR